MALATSGTINLTDVRDFYGQSGSINLTNLHKGESNVPNPATYATSNFTQISAASGSALPVALFDNGGVVPSLDTEANQNIPTSGSISLTDFYGGYRLVNPSVSSVSLSSQTHGSGYWAGTTPTANKGFYISNYAAFGSSTVNYAQLLTVNASAIQGGSFAASAVVTFQVSHTGIYTLHASHTGNETNGGSVTLSGSGVTLKNSSGSTVTGAQTISLGHFRLFEATIPSGTTITLTAATTAGSAGSYMSTQLRTNCNYQRNFNSTTSATNNVMLTQS
tara:strand:+ start:38 stop:868 length:831 start_codon:yes stop_codon:yes gene_type:complete